MNDEPPKGCLCYTKKTKGEFPKTFKSSSKILRKYKNNDLEVRSTNKNRYLMMLYWKLWFAYMFQKINKSLLQCCKDVESIQILKWTL